MRHLSAACLLALGACGQISIDRDNRPCGAGGACISGYVCDPATNLCVRASSACSDADRDGYGSGPACAGPDCDDASATCNVDCDSDSDVDGARDCDDSCIDADGDLFGTGTGCSGSDCDESLAACNVTCEDLDVDLLLDCNDSCVDVDHDGLGNGTLANAGCANATVDSDDALATICADTDADLCNDCSSGVFNPAADGNDPDGNGLCNLVCTDADGDGLGDGTDGNLVCASLLVDSNDSDPLTCADTDLDACDDCSSGSFAPGGDGADADTDGTCDAGDTCTDADTDGVGTGTLANSGCRTTAVDVDDADPRRCANTDADGCDDCAVASAWAPDNDGPDSNGDGLCDVIAVCNDVDGDGLGDGTDGNVVCVNATTDSNDADPTRCADTDADGCDDCSTGSFAPVSDGPDLDGDGLCDTGDTCTDADGDGLGNGSNGNSGCARTNTDSSDANPNACADTDADGCDDCSSGAFSTVNDGADGDADGRCDAGDSCTDADGDGLGNGGNGNSGCTNAATDSNDANRTLCADTDADTCDDCGAWSFLPGADGDDGDGDGICDAGDTCTDADGDGLGSTASARTSCANPTPDSNEASATVCADTDSDGCDDCSSGAFAPTSDGPDGDSDGTCDAGDTCTDADGDGLGSAASARTSCINTALDTNDAAASICADTDADSCDDCAVGGSFAPANDGTDGDADGICDAGDTCTDNDGDGVGTAASARTTCLTSAIDSNDADRNACTDSEPDSCDDCSVAGSFAPSNDGPDANGNGICDAGECTDLDGDGVAPAGGNKSGCPTMADDSDDNNAAVCVDTDGDGCDDCAGPGLWDPATDGTDLDGDGLCDAGDCDDNRPFCTTNCTDVDLDDYCVGFDCNDLYASCTNDCSDADSDGLAGCIESCCGSNPAVGGSVCTQVPAGGNLATAVAGNSFILVTGNVTTTASIDVASNKRICAARNAVISVDSGNNISGFVVPQDNSNVVFDGLTVANARNLQTAFELVGSGTVRNTWITSFETRGIYVNTPSGSLVSGSVIEDNFITGGTDPVSLGGSTGAIVVRLATATRIVGNVIAGNSMEGMKFRNTTNTFVDQNTLHSNGTNAIAFYFGSNTAFCLRNNLITSHTNAVHVDAGSVSWATTGACATPLPVGPVYGNNAQTGVRQCSTGSNCNFPAGSTMFPTTLNPVYVSTVTTDPRYLCITEAQLIDSGASLGYDRNGAAAGSFTGTGPEIGAREQHVRGCP